MTWININCGECGHTADMDEFSRDAAGRELPRAEYRCPNCGHHWRKVATSWTTATMPDGSERAVPETIELQPIQAAS